MQISYKTQTPLLRFLRFFIPLFIIGLLSSSCDQENSSGESFKLNLEELHQSGPFVVVLGNIQDAGSPHMGCEKSCCSNIEEERLVTCLGLVDPQNGTTYLFEASPDMVRQSKMLSGYLPQKENPLPDAIFLTHAHIGHYTGLMYLGKESINSNGLEVFAMPRMKSFLESNGPWDQLVQNGNIVINSLQESVAVKSGEISITPILVPHRDEYSETAAFLIHGPNKKLLFIPDIDKWGKWNRALSDVLDEVDYALVDGTFYNNDEIPNRDMAEIPHPFIIETMELLKDLPEESRIKIHFIHFNHSNPILKCEDEKDNVLRNGFGIADLFKVFSL